MALGKSLRLKTLVGVIATTAGLALVFNNCSAGLMSAPSEPSSTNLSVNPESTLAPGASATEFKCRPPRKYSYKILPGQERTFACAPTFRDVFNITVPDTGYAIARASLVFRNNHASQIYYWSASVFVGSSEIAYAQGDDVCPNTYTPVKRVLGYGLLSADNNSNVRVAVTQGSSPCVNDQISVFSGGELEVWVEDPDPRCHKKDINMASSYKTIGTAKYYWTTSMTKLVSLSVPPSTDRSSLLVLGAVEGSPEINPNTVCGTEAATLVAQAATNVHGIADTQVGTIPASSGMGHLVLSVQSQVSYSPSLNEVSLLVGSNTSAPVFTNDCCGDGKIGYVKQP